MSVIALDLGGTKLASALFRSEGPPEFRKTAPLAGKRGGDVGELLVAQIREILELSPEPVDAIGVAVPGISSPDGRVWAPNIPEWEEYPLRDVIREGLPSPEIRVTVESDRACCILGETWRGAARGCRNAAFLAVGTGIGAGILADGRILSGSNGSAGSLGWMALDLPWRATYGRCGCFEQHASGEGIAHAARALLLKNHSYKGVLRKREINTITAHDVFTAFEENDPLALSIIGECIEFWGMGAANLVSTLDPEVIVFGGGIFGPAARFLERIRCEAARWAQPVSMRRVVFTVSELGEDAALTGAARLVME